MKRSLGAIVAALGLLGSLLVSIGLVGPVPAAQAYCPADGPTVYYKFKDKVTLFHPTNIHSDWVYWPAGGTINYTKTKTAMTSASVTATVSAEAGVIFAKASTSLGVTVGRSWSQSDSWSYTANVPKGREYRWRLRMYHFSVNFKVMKRHWSRASCSYVNSWRSWQTVKHAPTKANRNIWKLQRARV
jgi:hypothetical protein